MGLQQRTYSMTAAPDWTRLASALEARTGVRVRVDVDRADVVTISARSIGGAAQVWFGKGHVEWEASLGANAYFLAHLHQGLVSIGATLHERGGVSQPDPLIRKWKELSLRERLAQGNVGQLSRGLGFLVLSPILLVGLVLANVIVVLRKAFSRAR